MAVFQKFFPFTEALAEKKHNLGSDVIKLMLTNVAPVNTNAVKADITEIAAGGGYVAGGITPVVVSSAQTGGVYKLVIDDVVITAVGGSMGPFRWVVAYNSTAAAQDLLSFWDYGAPVTLNVGETFTVDYDPANGVLTIT